jgi:hypothetical protein
VLIEDARYISPSGVAGWFGNIITVGTSIHDACHPIPETQPYFFQDFSTSLILCSIVKQCRNGLILIASIFQNEGGNS